MKEEILKKIVNYLVSESNYDIKISDNYEELKKVYKALVNLRSPRKISNEILELEDKYIKLELENKEIIEVDDLKEIDENIILWQGDITTLKCDGIVNAGNIYGLGCFDPSHNCIDNVIHTRAGMRLRLECNDILRGEKINVGEYIVCNGYNLPCKKIITTVGPQVFGNVTKNDEINLGKCYKNTLEYAIRNNYKSIAFPCISTGLYGYPISKAKYIAVNSVKEILSKYKTSIKVVFNVFNEEDYNEYRSLFKD